MLRRLLSLWLGVWLVVAPAWLALPLHVCPHTGEIELTACCDHGDEDGGHGCCALVAEGPDRAGPLTAPPLAEPGSVSVVWVAPALPSLAAPSSALPPARGPPRDPDRPPAAPTRATPTLLQTRALRI